MLMPALIRKNAPDYADRVNLIKKSKLDGSWRFAPVVPEANGRLKDKVRINGTIEVHTEGTYYIEWRDRGKRCRASVTREDAVDQARMKAIELRAMREGLIASPEPEPEARPRRRSEMRSTLISGMCGCSESRLLLLTMRRGAQSSKIKPLGG
jgi:hypothetical protein